MSSRDVSDVIFKQLGGHRFVVMTGACNFVYDDTSLLFKVKAMNKSMFVKIVYHKDTDLYSMEFFKMGKHFIKKDISRYENVGCDQLCEIFTNVTGLYTHL
jgi:hypothetical protein